MVKAIILLLIGALIGWNVPQPQWAFSLTIWIKKKVRDFMNRD